jgi:hypothetical protein
MWDLGNSNTWYIGDAGSAVGWHWLKEDWVCLLNLLVSWSICGEWTGLAEGEILRWNQREEMVGQPERRQRRGSGVGRTYRADFDEV